MARACLCVLFLALFFLDGAISVDPPTAAPSPAPELGADGPSVPEPSAGDDGAPASAPSGSPFSSPPSPSAPSPDLGESPDSSPVPSPAESADSAPVPAPATSESDVGHINADEEVHDGEKGSGGGKKAGIAFGVIAAAGLVAGAGCVIKKRRENERRAQYGYAMRREIL